MSYPLSRLLHLATATYGGFAAVKPDHLPDAMEVGPAARDGYRLVAYGWTVRELPLGVLGGFGPAATVPLATALRIAFDLGDALTLSLHTDKQSVRAKVLGVTLSWASLNALALLVDQRRRRRALLPS